MEKTIQELSKRNLNKLLSKTAKYKIINDIIKVESAIKGLSFFHCTNQENITEIIKNQEIRTKDNLSANVTMTNGSTDIAQGLDRHVSLSIGKPWQEYGNYCFSLTIDKVSDESLFFFIDPWMLKSHHLEDYVLTKEDFIILIKDLLLKNLGFYNKSFIFKFPFKRDLHGLASFNLRNFEAKNDKNIKFDDISEFFIWTSIDSVMYTTVRLFWNKLGLLSLIAGMFLVMRLMQQ